MPHCDTAESVMWRGKVGALAGLSLPLIKPPRASHGHILMSHLVLVTPQTLPQHDFGH